MFQKVLWLLRTARVMPAPLQRGLLQLPLPLWLINQYRICRLVILSEEFVKTPKRSIKRYLYSAERLNLN